MLWIELTEDKKERITRKHKSQQDPKDANRQNAGSLIKARAEAQIG